MIFWHFGITYINIIANIYLREILQFNIKNAYETHQTASKERRHLKMSNKYHVTQDISAQTCLIVFKLVLKITGSFLYSMCIERLKARRHGSEYGLVILQHHKCPSQIRKLTRRSNYRDTTFQYAEVIVSHQASIMNSSKRQLGNQIIKDF